MTRVKIKYRFRLLLYFLLLLVFAALAATVWFSKQNRSYSVAAIQKELKSYNTTIYNEYSSRIRASNISTRERVDFTILDSLGYVIYNSKQLQESYEECQIDHPEIVQAKSNGEGIALRASNFNDSDELIYYAKNYGDIYIVTYSPFILQEPIQVEKDNKYFLLIATILTALIVASLLISRKLSKPLKSYIDLTHAIKNNEEMGNIKFGNDDFGNVGKEIANTFKQLEEAKKYKQQMSHNIAHELKTPVTAIKAYLETIISSPDMPESKKMEFIDKTYSQTLRLSYLINEVSTLNKIEEAKMLKDSQPFYKIEDVDINNCIEDVYQEIEIKLTEHNISFENQIEGSLHINGCYSLIYSLFKNLIDNTIEHGGDGCKITLYGKRGNDAYQNSSMKRNMPDVEIDDTNQGTIYFEYRDNGKGVPQDKIDRIFERFYRIDEGRTRKTGGSGLGLAIVKNAVSFHKGNIEASNLEGQGIVFKFYLKSI